MCIIPIKQFPATRIFFLPINLPTRTPIDAKTRLLQVIKNDPVRGERGKLPSVNFYNYIRMVVENTTTGPIAVVWEQIDSPKQTQVALRYFGPNKASLKVT